MSRLSIREARTSDAGELLEIYRSYVEDTAISFEYEVPSLEEFQHRIEDTLKIYPYLVGVVDGRIIGYAYAGTFKSREAYAWSVETTIYLKMDQRGFGYGRKLYEVLEAKLKEQHILNANACIAYTEVEDKYLTNASQGFHQRMGYEMVGTFHKSGYKFGRWYHMIWMEKMLGKHESKPEKMIPYPKLDRGDDQ